MNKKEWLQVINDRQDMYVTELVQIIETSDLKKIINFNSPTGTGKTVMISKLISKMRNSDYFFLITSLSKGGLNKQIKLSLSQRLRNDNYLVYGVSSYTSKTRIQEKELLSKIPKEKKLIWIRDEGHIKSNNWTKLLLKIAYKVVNFSATNHQVDIQCNFSDTPMLRTPYQIYGTPEEAVKKLLYVKEVHKRIQGYNPCMIVRDVSGRLTDVFVRLCDYYKLKYIDIFSNDVDVQSLCKDDNEYDVIINKLKITEGIDIPRANVIYIGNRPNNDATTIQLIGRVRRNALLWRKDLDIFSPENKELLNETTKTYVYYDRPNSAIQTENEELIMELSDTISVEQLLPNHVNVTNNCLENGYKISELSLLKRPYSGLLELDHSKKFVYIKNLPSLYQTNKKLIHECGLCFQTISKDKEMVLISLDKTKFVRLNKNGTWKTATTIADNIGYGKLNSFIQQQYIKEIEYFERTAIILPHKTTKNDLRIIFGQYLHSLIVNYFIYLVYGNSYFSIYLEAADSLFKAHGCKLVSDEDKTLLAVSLFYKNNMLEYYGESINPLIKSISPEELLKIDNKYKKQLFEVVNEVYVRLYEKKIFDDCHSFMYSQHFGNPKLLHGVCDFVTIQALIQFIYKEHFEKSDLYKILALHFLSKRRLDLKVTSLFIYNVFSETMIEISIADNNIASHEVVSPRFEKRTIALGKLLSPSKFNFSNFYKIFGEKAVLDLIESQKDSLHKKGTLRLDQKNQNGFVSNDALLFNVSKFSNQEITHKVLLNIKPNKKNLLLAIRTKDFEAVSLLAKRVLIDKEILIEGIKNADVQIMNELIKYTDSVNSDIILFAIKNKKTDLLQYLLPYARFTRQDAKLILKTKNIETIEALYSQIEPTTSNLAIAIKGGDLQIIKILLSKISSVTKQSVEIARLCKNIEIVSVVEEKFKTKKSRT